MKETGMAKRKLKSKFEVKKDRKIYADYILKDLERLNTSAKALESVGLTISQDIYSDVAHIRAMMYELYKTGTF